MICILRLLYRSDYTYRGDASSTRNSLVQWHARTRNGGKKDGEPVEPLKVVFLNTYQLKQKALDG